MLEIILFAVLIVGINISLYILMRTHQLWDANSSDNPVLAVLFPLNIIASILAILGVIFLIYSYVETWPTPNAFLQKPLQQSGGNINTVPRR